MKHMHFDCHMRSLYFSVLQEFKLNKYNIADEIFTSKKSCMNVSINRSKQ